MEDDNARDNDIKDSNDELNSVENPVKTETQGGEAEVPLTPPVEMPIDNPPTAPNPEESPVPKKKLSKKVLLPLVLVGLLLVGGGAAGYVTYFQKTPEKNWSKALQNTSLGLEEFISSTNYDKKGVKFSGSLAVSSPISVSASVAGQWYESQGSMTSDINAMGSKFNAEVRTLKASDSGFPDIYMKIDGLESIAGLLGLGTEASPEIAGILDNFNSKWLEIDGKTAGSYLSALQPSSAPTSPTLSAEDLQAIAQKMTAVMKDRLFTDDTSKAVFKIGEKLGKENFEGTPSYKFKVSIDKDNFKEFVVAFKDAIKDSKMKDLLLAGQSSKTIEEVLSFEELIKSIDSANFSNATAHVWVEANGGYIRNIRIYPVKDDVSKNYIDIGMTYDGGDSVPIILKTTVDDNGDKGVVSVVLTLNKKDPTIGIALNVNMSAPQAVTAEFKLDMTATDEQVKVEKPSGAVNLMELVGGYLGGALSGSSALDTSLPTGFNLDDIELQ